MIKQETEKQSVEKTQEVKNTEPQEETTERLTFWKRIERILYAIIRNL